MMMYVSQTSQTKTSEEYTAISFELTDDDLSRLFSHGYIELPITGPDGSLLEKIVVYRRGAKANMDRERGGS